jgi:predicted GNAT family acetyltransferase
MWVLEHNHKPVACTAFNSTTKEAVQIGGVWTPLELRGRGYARCAVAASLLDARAEGARQAILFTGINNVAAQKAYLALGFEHVGDYRILLLRPPLKNRWMEDK